MSKNKFLIFLVGFTLTLFSHSQIVVEGIVQDTLQNPLPSISVVLKTATTNTIIAYDYTDEHGKYSISVDFKEDLKLFVSGLTYHSQEIILKKIVGTDANLIRKNFLLYPKTTSLDEVIVNADKPIITRNDTISIKVEPFLNGTEEVVEDILKKLPGIEVTKDGTVMVQGKSVEKVLVEGDDLFERGYKLLTKNLNAGVIDKVEILEHYSENILLKNIENSEKVAINLAFKEDGKKKLFGTLSLSKGTNNFYEEKANLISFNDKTKYYFFGNLNNIGSDAIGDIYQLIYPDLFTSTTYLGDGEKGINLINLAANTPNLEESKYNFNNAELASLNVIFKPNKRTKIKGLFFFTSDEKKFNSTSIEQFDLPPTSFVNNENYLLRKNSSAITGKLDALFSLNEKNQIEYVGRYSLGDFREKTNLDFNLRSINERLKGNTEFTDHRITYTNKINNFSAIQVTGRYIYDHRPQDFFVDSFVFDELFPSRENIEAISQNSFNRLKFGGLEGSFILNRNKNNLSLKIGYTSKSNHLDSQINLIDTNGVYSPAGGMFTNNFNYNIGDIYLNANYIYNFKNCSLRPNIEMHQLFVNANNIESNPFFVVPGLGFSWNINKNNKFFSSYKYSSKNISLNSIYSNFSLTGYRALRAGVGDFQQLRGHFFLGGYVLGNWSDSFLINTSIIYNYDNNYLSSNSIVNSNFVQTSSIVLDNREFYSANLSVDKFIEKLSSNFKLKISVSKNQYQNIVNLSELRNVDATTFTYGGEYRSAFSGPLNFHLGTNWNRSIIESSNDNENLENVSFFDINFQLSKKLLFSLISENYHFGNLTVKKNFTFSDFEAIYNFKRNKYKVTFVASNILNTKTFSNINISDTGFFSNDFRLLPRYLLLKFEFRF